MANTGTENIKTGIVERLMIERVPNEWRYRHAVTKQFYPWYTKPCLEWLVTLDLKRKRIFEYGCGDSTKWYREQGALVYGVESYPLYAGPDIYVTEEEDEYIREPFSYPEHFDIIIIDGLFRDKCTSYALRNLKSKGYLIIDNWMQPSVEMNWTLTEKLIKGLPQKLFVEPCHYYPWQTLVVTKA
jgi:hypothetical protein